VEVQMVCLTWRSSSSSSRCCSLVITIHEYSSQHPFLLAEQGAAGCFKQTVRTLHIGLLACAALHE
jgi:hypothetical protein